MNTSKCYAPGCKATANPFADGLCTSHFNRVLGKPDTQPGESGRGAGLKFDSGKPRWSLMMQGCALSLLGVVRVLTFGAKKYAAHSWREVENGEERYRDALYRHLHEIERGEAIDPESGESHWSHVITNAMFLEELRIAREKK